MTGWTAGLFWLLIAGIGQGVFPLPMKFTRNWKWEHLWLWYSAIAFLLLPLITALLTVPRLAEVYKTAPLHSVLLIATFGLAWGIGSVFFGLGIDSLGMSLGFPIMTGLTTALGALIPMMALTPDLLLKRAGIVTIAGNLVTIAGVGVCAIAGERRDRKLGRGGTQSILGPSRRFATALGICILSGVFSAMFNFGYAFGRPIIDPAVVLGATPDNAVNAVWLVVLPSGGFANVLYCIHLLRKNKSGEALWRGDPVRDCMSAITMAVLWTGSVIVYGWGANALGNLGATLGWSLWNAILIASTVIGGILTHEWDGVRGPPWRLLWLGIFILIAGMFVLGAGV